MEVQILMDSDRRLEYAHLFQLENTPDATLHWFDRRISPEIFLASTNVDQEEARTILRTWILSHWIVGRTIYVEAGRNVPRRTLVQAQ